MQKPVSDADFPRLDAETGASYDFASGTVPDPGPTPADLAEEPEDRSACGPGCPNAAAILQAACCRLVYVAGGNPNRLSLILLRMAGLTYAEAGSTLAMSKQGMDKHLRAIESTTEGRSLAALFRTGFSSTGSSATDRLMHEARAKLDSLLRGESVRETIRRERKTKGSSHGRIRHIDPVFL